jgi:hypothetical protein
MIAQSVGCSLGCSHSQLGMPVNPLVRRCFRGSFGGLAEGVGALGFPEKLIKMATGLRLVVQTRLGWVQSRLNRGSAPTADAAEPTRMRPQMRP